MKKAVSIALLIAAMFSLVSCASSDQASNSSSSDQKVSTIPWNKPQKWEGQGMLGGMMNQ